MTIYDDDADALEVGSIMIRSLLISTLLLTTTDDPPPLSSDNSKEEAADDCPTDDEIDIDLYVHLRVGQRVVLDDGGGSSPLCSLFCVVVAVAVAVVVVVDEDGNARSGPTVVVVE